MKLIAIREYQIRIRILKWHKEITVLMLMRDMEILKRTKMKERISSELLLRERQMMNSIKKQLINNSRMKKLIQTVSSCWLSL